MKRKFTKLMAALALLTCLVPLTGWGQTKATKTEGFQTADATTEYQGAYTIDTDESDCGVSWKIYYGTVSTSSAITDGKSAALRLYTSSNYGYIKTTTAIEGLSNVALKAKAATTNNALIKINIDYSSDGNNWANIESDKTLTTSAASYNWDIPNGGKYFRISISENSTKPSSKNAQLTIDDVVFTYTSSLTPCNLALADAPVALDFDLNNASSQTIAYTTSGTGSVSVNASEYVTTSVDQNNKTITVTPKAITPATQTLTVSQLADATHDGGSTTFTVAVADNTPGVSFIAGTNVGANINSGTADTITNGNVTITSTNAAFATDEYRLYSGSKTTFSVPTGYSITRISFAVASGYSPSKLSANKGTYVGGVWTGDASSVQFTADGQVRVNKMIVSIQQDNTPAILPANVTAFEDELEVTINSVSGTTVYYNINSESNPTSSSTQYTGPFTITETSTIKAIAYDNQNNASSVSTVTYTKEEFDDIWDVEDPEEQYYVRGTVVAASSKGFVLADNTYQIYVYLGNATIPNVGDKRKVQGSPKQYNKILEFDYNATVSVATGSNYDGNTPNIAGGDDLYEVITDEYVHWTYYDQFNGTLTKDNDDNYLINVSGDEHNATAMVSYPTTAQIATLETLLNKTVCVKGYFSGVKDDTYYTVTLESINEIATVSLEDLTGHNGEDGHYYLIASPVTVDPTTTGMITDDGSNPENLSYDLYYFDQSEDAEWRNYRQEAFDFVPGKGYLYSNREDIDQLSFTGPLYNGNGTVDLDYDENAEFAGWNLIGNPYTTEATLDMPFYKMNDDGDGLTAKIEDLTNTIAVMEGVFVQATATTPTATFTAQSGKGEKKSIAKVELMLNGNKGVVDNAIVRFDEGQTLEKFMLNANGTKLYFTEGNKDYAIVRSSNEGEMPVSFKASANGTYTLSVNPENVEMNYLHLIDNKTGTDVDLLATPSYSFEAKTSDYASRFRLVFSANSVEEQNAEPFAFFNGDSWTVSNQGEATLQVIDMMGRVLSSETLNGNANVNLNQTAGIYMLRLVNGNDVKVQKVVVR